MGLTAEEVRSPEDLRAYVHQTLCRHENLLPDQFPLSESVLRRGGRECGRHFALYGPRSVHLSAVWAAERNVVYFYGAAGERFLKAALARRPPAAGESA